MKILLLQTDIAWQQPESNLKKIESLLKKSEKADLIILPEMFTTGFCTAPDEAAEKLEPYGLEFMRKLAKIKNAAVTGSVAVSDNGKYYNRMYFVKPDGSFVQYDKKHLFTYGGEHKQYTAGTERVIVEHAEFRILLQVCYDLRFPVFSRNRGDYDMIIYVASWPVQRSYAWNTLLRARAIENQCYVAGVNRVGEDPTLHYSGGTVLLDYFGKPVVETELDKEEVILGEADLQALTNFRNSFPALNDADAFTLTDI